ncbi:MAG: HEAT repeat domain-containing protein [Methanomicrobiales archaeon]|nr:HEAT repeat domain-containing protein [Methanomicrobiales archaeon]
MTWRSILYPLLTVEDGKIAALREAGDTRGLVHLLSHPDPRVQDRAGAALATLGPAALDPLLSALRSPRPHVRMGAAEGLAPIRDPRAGDALARLACADPVNEVRWAAAVALGEHGDPRQIPVLVRTLHDPDRYVRSGAAGSLRRLGWIPTSGGERADLAIALQEWDRAAEEGAAAVEPLTRVLSDRNPAIRARAVDALGRTGHGDASGACNRALGDPVSRVRWQATLAFPRCGVPLTHLPLGITRRPKTGKHPAVAVFLNFFFPGLGYNYLGAWWGLICFQTISTVVVLLSLAIGPALPTVLQYSVSTLIALQTWLAVRTLPREDPM